MATNTRLYNAYTTLTSSRATSTIAVGLRWINGNRIKCGVVEALLELELYNFDNVVSGERATFPRSETSFALRSNRNAAREPCRPNSRPEYIVYEVFIKNGLQITIIKKKSFPWTLKFRTTVVRQITRRKRKINCRTDKFPFTVIFFFFKIEIWVDNGGRSETPVIRVYK